MAVKKNTNLVEITHYVCQSVVFAELSGRPYTRLPFSNSALMASFVRSYPQYRYLDSLFFLLLLWLLACNNSKR